MEPILALRPFVPAKDFPVAKRFYTALGFTTLHESPSVAVLQLGEFGFILQNFYVKDHADNCMLQLMVRDVDAWWQAANPARLVGEFAVKPPLPPTMQHWGLKVGYIFDPTGVLWHVTEQPS